MIKSKDSNINIVILLFFFSFFFPFIYTGERGRGEDGVETINGVTQIVGQSLEHHSPSKY